MTFLEDEGLSVGELFRKYFSADFGFGWLDNVDLSLVEKVMTKNFNGGRYVWTEDQRGKNWLYLFPGMVSLEPIGVVEDSILAIEKPFFYCHSPMPVASMSSDMMQTIHRWCLKEALFYPVFVWRNSMNKQRIEPYVLCPKEGDAVLLAAYFSA